MTLFWWKKTQLKTTSPQIKKVSVMTFGERFVYALLVSLALVFLLRYFIWWVNPQHIPRNFIDNAFLFTPLINILIFTILTFVVFLGALLKFATWFALWFTARPQYVSPQEGLKVALLTCFVPQKEPYEILEDTLRAMTGVRYPHDSWVLDEGDDPQVKRLCAELGVKHFSRFGVEKYNQEKGYFRAKTKAGNHNAWLDSFENDYDIVGQVDVDHAPKEEFLERTLGYFTDSKVALVVMPQYYKNLDNWIARGAAEQAYLFHGPMQKGFYGSDMPFLIGTSHIYRTSAMKGIGGYAPTIVEDHLTGMNFYAKSWKGVFVPEILAEGEGPSNWVDYFNQQMRWSYGLFEILFKHTPKLIFKLKWRHKINYFFAQLYYFVGTAVFFGIALTILYLIFGLRAANMNLFEWSRYAFPAFFFAIIVQVYSHRFQLDPKHEPYFGLLGMFLNLGANLIYFVAFFNFLTGKKLRYVVTQKGSTAQKQDVPLRTFYPHLTIASFTLFALIASVVQGHGAIQLRLWGLFNFLTLSAVAASIYWDKIYAYIKSYRFVFLAFRYSLRLSYAFIFILFLTFAYSQKTLIAQAFFAPTKEVQSLENIFVPLAGKLNPPQEGAWLGVSLYDSGEMKPLVAAEERINRKFTVVGYYQSWGAKNNEFNAANAQFLSERGATPFITWEPWKPVGGFSRRESEVNQEDFRLKNIIDGKYDNYITSYALDVKSFKKPIMIRFAHEMNGDWYPWGSTLNTPQEYVLAWRHVHDIFSSVGATNVTWVWAPNEIYFDGKTPLASKINLFYPGEAYVDWIGFSSFNWGSLYGGNSWRTPEKMFDQSVSFLKQYDKPIIIAETASIDLSEDKDKKALWIRQLSDYVISHPEIKGMVWFNTSDGGIDWSINTSTEAEAAFREVFSRSYFK